MFPLPLGKNFFFLLDRYVQKRQWQPTPVLLPGKSHGWRNLVGCSPWGHYESDTTEWLHFHFSLSCIGEGNGNPLQCSCLENPRDGGAWWAAVYGVAQNRIRLTRLSGSSINLFLYMMSVTLWDLWIWALISFFPGKFSWLFHCLLPPVSFPFSFLFRSTVIEMWGLLDCLSNVFILFFSYLASICVFIFLEEIAS